MGKLKPIVSGSKLDPEKEKLRFSRRGLEKIKKNQGCFPGLSYGVYPQNSRDNFPNLTGEIVRLNFSYLLFC
jgi:hypothetical protein